MNIPSNSKENKQQQYNPTMQEYAGNRLYPSKKTDGVHETYR